MENEPAAHNKFERMKVLILGRIAHAQDEADMAELQLTALEEKLDKLDPPSKEF